MSALDKRFDFGLFTLKLFTLSNSTSLPSRNLTGDDGVRKEIMLLIHFISCPWNHEESKKAEWSFFLSEEHQWGDVSSQPECPVLTQEPHSGLLYGLRWCLPHCLSPLQFISGSLHFLLHVTAFTSLMFLMFPVSSTPFQDKLPVWKLLNHRCVFTKNVLRNH